MDANGYVFRETTDPLDEDCGAVPVEDWPKEVDEPVDLLVIHMNYLFARDADKRRWRQWCLGHWTDFNGGGWVWQGLCGTVVAVRPARAHQDWWE